VVPTGAEGWANCIDGPGAELKGAAGLPVPKVGGTMETVAFRVISPRTDRPAVLQRQVFQRQGARAGHVEQPKVRRGRCRKRRTHSWSGLTDSVERWGADTLSDTRACPAASHRSNRQSLGFRRTARQQGQSGTAYAALARQRRMAEGHVLGRWAGRTNTPTEKTNWHVQTVRTDDLGKLVGQSSEASSIIGLHCRHRLTNRC
jgi:hypothetical protein